MIGDPDGAPSFPMAGIGDVMTGVHAACAIANIVKSSLGPTGLDKMLVDDVGDVTVTYATSSGSAVAGADFIDTSGSLQIADGSSSAILFITILDDSDIEPAESFLVTLTGATNAIVGSPAVLPITITDNDAPTSAFLVYLPTIRK